MGLHAMEMREVEVMDAHIKAWTRFYKYNQAQESS
jgi:hypothetical protein